MKQLIVLCLLLIPFTSIHAQTKKTAVEFELSVYQSLINELYNFGYCHQVVTPPFYACCNNNKHMSVESHVACCEESDIPESHRIYCQDCINIGELDTLTLMVEVIDSLYPIDFDDYKDWILDNIDTSNGFHNFILNGEFTQNKIGFDLPSLQQKITKVTIKNKDDKKEDFTFESIQPKNVVFATEQEVVKINKKRASGKSNDHLILGRIGMSRVYFDDSGNKAFFYFAYLGKNNCGFEDIVLTEKVNGKWTISQKISLEAF